MTMCIWIPQYRNFCVMCVGGNIVYFVCNNHGLYHSSVWQCPPEIFQWVWTIRMYARGYSHTKSRVCSFTFLQLMCCLLSSCCGTAGRFLQSTQISSYLNYACLFHCTKQINLIIFYTVCKCLHYLSMHACYIQSITVIGFNFVLVNLHMRILM